MIFKIALLIVPVIVLFGVLYYGNNGDGIGGGGYDLSELVYSGILVLFLIGFNVWTLATLIMAKTELDKHNHKILLAIGILVTTPVIVWFVKQLR